MGLRFSDTILSLATGMAAVFAVYMIGHALSAGAGWAWIAAAISAILALAVGVLTARRIRRYAARYDSPGL